MRNSVRTERSLQPRPRVATQPRWLGVAAAAAAIILAAPGILAQSPEAQSPEAQSSDVAKAREYFRAGAQAYSIGEFAVAVQAFEQAYAIAPRPAVLFSIAQAEKRLYFVAHEARHLERSIRLYREYLQSPPPLARKSDALQALSELEPLAAKGDNAGEPRPPAASTDDGRTRDASPQPTRIMLASPSEGARLSLDGGEPQSSPLIREVSPGEHEARIEAPGYDRDVRRILAVGGALVTYDVVLKEQPATLAIHAPSGAELSIDGRVQGTFPFPKPLAVSAGTHLISVTKRGYDGWATELRVGRGERATLVASMPRSFQRTTALIMFGTAASAMTASGIFAYFAVGQENSAKEFLAARGNGSLDASALSDYQSVRADRDRLRFAALASAGVGLGLAAAGAVLFNYDSKAAPEPAPRTLTLRDQVSLRRPVTSEKPLNLAPETQVGPGFIGLSLKGSF